VHVCNGAKLLVIICVYYGLYRSQCVHVYSRAKNLSHTLFTYYSLYRRLSVYVYRGAKKLVTYLTYITAYIDASMYMSIEGREN
jgi:hypothetical protein